MHTDPTAPVRLDTLPEIPRSAWKDHENYPAQTLLLRSHESFRRFTELLVDNAREGATSDALHWLFLRLIGAMRGHESYEERKLYPFLEARWGLDLTELCVDHQRLHELERAVLDALESGEDATAALTAHRDALAEHLDREEELVIPGLLALTPDEFRAYYFAA